MCEWACPHPCSFWLICACSVVLIPAHLCLSALGHTCSCLFVLVPANSCLSTLIHAHPCLSVLVLACLCLLVCAGPCYLVTLVWVSFMFVYIVSTNLIPI